MGHTSIIFLNLIFILFCAKTYGTDEDGGIDLEVDDNDRAILDYLVLRVAGSRGSSSAAGKKQGGKNGAEREKDKPGPSNSSSKVFLQYGPAPKFDNPNFVRDRFRYIIKKPTLPDAVKNRHRKPFHPAWMDYCDPYHCDDYHKTVCGLNRYHMRFRWFQSTCHLILNNMCSTYRGFLKYDLIENKHCFRHVMELRSGCPVDCEDIGYPVCAKSTIDNHLVLFKSACAMENENCQSGTLQEYEEIDMKTCLIYYQLRSRYNLTTEEFDYNDNLIN